ncbi:hypothetical protein BC938DRAFT_475048 [Jimgerdemannia flammicorona]|uniref:Zn(2)-C6 fungal-type domain-containing protein n=1 Tax=Jimgerdemannia flammicorona TaxID=994334 RepID=A0A433Q110_9FUNG|nr:hypothetical protein BC938DRAFT_475048 [Jimgerdemannia flammicorona]
MLEVHESPRQTSDPQFAHSHSFYPNAKGFSSSFAFSPPLDQNTTAAVSAGLDERTSSSATLQPHHHHSHRVMSPPSPRRPSANRASPPYSVTDRPSHNVPTPPPSTSPGPTVHRDVISGTRASSTGEQSDTSDMEDYSTPVPAKRANKTHVPSACVNCKRAHLACDVSRPCKRCVSLGKTDSCVDIQHKKRGRPKLRDKKSFIPTSMMGENKYAMSSSPGFLTLNGTANSLSPLPTTPMPFTIQQPSGTKVYQPSVDLNAHAASPKFVHAQLPAAAVPYRTATSSFSMTVPTVNEQQDHQQRVITVYLSMEICCARVSDEVYELWEYYPQELAHRSLYDFISGNDTERLARLHRLLLDNVMAVGQRNDPHYRPGNLPPTERTSSDLFFHTSPMVLSAVASGSQTFSDTLHIKKRSGDYELFEMKVYLGGGLGADLSNPATYSKLYVVAMLTKHQYTVSSPASAIAHAVTTVASLSRRSSIPSSPVSVTSQTLTTIGGSTNNDSFRLDQTNYQSARDQPHPASSSLIPPQSKMAREATSSSTLQFGKYSTNQPMGGDRPASPKTSTSATSRPPPRQQGSGDFRSSATTTTTSSPPSSSTSSFRLRTVPSTSMRDSSPLGAFRPPNSGYSSGSHPYTPPSASFTPSAYNHPTQQYSSSATLNTAAASAAQLYHPEPLYNNGSSSVSGSVGKMEDEMAGNDRAVGPHLSGKPTKPMSVNSLLC